MGFYLRLRQQDWGIDEHYFVELKKYLPKSIHYMDRQNRYNGKYIKEWRLVVPQELIQLGWEEIFDMGDI